MLATDYHQRFEDLSENSILRQEAEHAHQENENLKQQLSRITSAFRELTLMTERERDFQYSIAESQEIEIGSLKKQLKEKCNELEEHLNEIQKERAIVAKERTATKGIIENLQQSVESIENEAEEIATSYDIDLPALRRRRSARFEKKNSFVGDYKETMAQSIRLSRKETISDLSIQREVEADSTAESNL